jgi:hypothetical protein
MYQVVACHSGLWWVLSAEVVGVFAFEWIGAIADSVVSTWQVTDGGSTGSYCDLPLYATLY